MVPGRCRERRRVARFIDIEIAPPRFYDTDRLVVWACALIFLAAAAFATLQQSGRTDVGRLLVNSDYTAYYCDGLVARQHNDPYLAGPMEQCNAYASNPAPLPGYVTAVFSIASFAPEQVGAALWALFLCAALVLTVWALYVATDVSPLALAAAVFGTDLVAGLSFGQLSVVTTLGVALCAMTLGRGKYVGAALAALLALVQPQVGVPVVLALALWAPATRRVLLVGVVALITLSYLHLGIAENTEFVRRAIPAFNASEVPLRFQYSMAWLLYFLGADEPGALVASFVQYAFTVGLALAFAPTIVRRLGSPAALAAFPAASAVLGGLSVHLADLAVALPFAAVLAGTKGWTRTAGVVALIGLAVPWIALETPHGFGEVIAQGVADGIIVALIALFAVQDRPWLVRSAVALGALALVIVAPLIFDAIPDNALRPAPAAASFDGAHYGDGLAAVAHARALRSQSILVEPTLQNFFRKAPDAAAVGLLFLVGLAFARSGRRIDGLAAENLDPFRTVMIGPAPA